MNARLDAFRPYLLLFTLPVAALWAPALGTWGGVVAATLLAVGGLFISSWWTRADLARGHHPRLALTRDRFAVDRDALDMALPMFAALTAAMLVALLLLAPLAGLYALAILAAGLWNATLTARRRQALLEAIIPVALLIGPAMLLRAPAWQDQPEPAIPPAAHAAAWLAGLALALCVVACMTRDREADLAAGADTIATKLSRPGAVAIVALLGAGVTLLAGLGAIGWWGVTPVILSGWTGAAVIAGFIARWDGWAIATAIYGYGLVTLAACAGVATRAI
jgi:hypothetical protein